MGFRGYGHAASVVVDRPLRAERLNKNNPRILPRRQVLVAADPALPHELEADHLESRIQHVRGCRVVSVISNLSKRPPNTHRAAAWLLAEVLGHEAVDVALHVLIEDLAQRSGDLGLRVHAIQLACADSEATGARSWRRRLSRERAHCSSSLEPV